MNNRKIITYLTYLIKMGIGSVILLLSIFAVSRMVTQQILVDKLNMDGELLRIIGFGRNAKDIPIGNLKAEIVGKSIVNVDWEEEYPFKESDVSSYEDIKRIISGFTNELDTIKENIEFYTTDSLFGKSVFEKIGKKYDQAIQWNLATSQNEIIFLENGYLTNTVEQLQDDKIDELVESVNSLYAFTQEEGIDFLYVNAGSKVCPYDKQLPYGSREYSNENADALLNGLKEKEIPYMDMRKEMIDDKVDWYDAYYRSDHHWKTSTGLWAAGKIAEVLNDQYAFSFDLEYFDPTSYEITEYPNLWLGGQGRTIGHEYAEKDSYEKIIPKYETDYTVEIPSTGYNAQGVYEETMFKEALFQKVLAYSDTEMLSMPDAYHCSILNNNDLAIIRNNLVTNNKGKRLLILQDSFSWYLTSYLVSDIEQVDVITVDSFSGSIQTYIEKTKPDAVIMIYCARNITPIEWTHQHMFDLR